MKPETKEENRSYCENCRFACQATECECVCHTQNEGFNYGLKLGRQEVKKEFIKLFNELIAELAGEKLK